MDWRRVDERLIRRGELLLSLDFLDDYDYELSVMNDGKVGRPFKMENIAKELSAKAYIYNMLINLTKLR
jgi:hypothetical protein